YKSDIPESVHHADGRAIKTGSSWLYEYWIKDHLGNIRTTFKDKNADNIIDFSDHGSTSAFILNVSFNCCKTSHPSIFQI
ncbi:MAG: hypothetical protein WAT22_07340, partial [Saprospiraceae bacterium]